MCTCEVDIALPLPSLLPPWLLLRMLAKWCYWLVWTVALITPCHFTVRFVKRDQYPAHIRIHAIDAIRRSRFFVTFAFNCFPRIWYSQSGSHPTQHHNNVYTHLVNLIKIEHFSCSLLFVHSLVHLAHYSTNLLKTCFRIFDDDRAASSYDCYIHFILFLLLLFRLRFLLNGVEK